ncbi:unnamed protein product [Ectocarpus sp. 12 AP-2014]
MKLNEEQNREIEGYLETKGVYQIDLKYEILDHITSGVENSMENQGFNFQKSFELEQTKWQAELNSLKISKYNIDFKTPKIVLRRYWAVIREMYTKAFVMTLGAFMSIFIFVKSGMVPAESFNTVFGYFYLTAFIIIALSFLKMKSDDTNTVDKMIFKTTMGYFMAWLIVFNPLLTQMYWVFQAGEVMIVFLTIHSFLMCFSFNFMDLYKNHRKKMKMYSL